MKFYIKKWAYIFLSPGYDSEKHTVTLDNGQTKFIAIGLDPKDMQKSLAITKNLVEDGVQMIELCGGFGPLWVAKLKEITDYKIPIGSVMYGPEDRATLLTIVRGADVIFP